MSQSAYFIYHEEVLLQYRQRHSVKNHCDRHITHLGDLDISFVLLHISSKFLLPLECFLLSPKRHIKISKRIKHTKRYISITVIYHAMYLTVLYLITQIPKKKQYLSVKI